mmetsp:Transcript_29207/g.44127  ORF Transcript_29207/g.44127 Transcript_29207/m.44127 type:complete len:108 (-) Transcript_29207:659-982(-)
MFPVQPINPNIRCGHTGADHTRAGSRGYAVCVSGSTVGEWGRQETCASSELMSSQPLATSNFEFVNDSPSIPSWTPSSAMHLTLAVLQHVAGPTRKGSEASKEEHFL